MKFIELPGQIDLMSTVMISQGMMFLSDESLSETERTVKNQICCLIPAMFCSAAIHIAEHMNMSLTPTLMAINEPGIRDGVYEYLFIEKPALPPVIDSRIDGFCIYGSIDPNKPKIEIYYGEELIVSVDLIVSGVQVVPNIIDLGTTKAGLSDTSKVVIDGLNAGITRFHASRIAGYKAGYEMGMEDGADE